MSSTSPFKFLDAYNKADRAIFFGREEEIETLYEMAHQTNLTLVYGQSGTGKTSLIQCGLANRFQSSDWFDVYIRRNDEINQSLLQGLKKLDSGKKTSQGTLLERLQKHRKVVRATTGIEETEGLSPVIKALRSLHKHYLKPIYLIFDQFEELF
ncbi:MAG: ATP-binding protein, partial [Saprospiraceae bacterium]|nr:ATP-binding protein [Saprospiraceae bacterium]